LNNLVELVDKYSELDSQVEALKKKMNSIASKIQQQALKVMDNKKVKTVQYFGSNNNYVLVTKASKVDLIAYKQIKEVFKDITENYVKEKDPQYELKKEFKLIASGIFEGDIEKKPLKDVLKEIGLNDAQVKLAVKKLKLDYIKDKRLLQSLGLKDDDIEAWIFFIHEAMINEKIEKALDAAGYKEGTEEYKEALNKIKTAVIVEETPKITVNYKKAEVN
jgi:hypothetical protein